MNTPLDFYIVNLSSRFNDDVAFEQMVHACDLQIAHDFCDEWGRYGTVTCASSVDSVPDEGRNDNRIVLIQIVDETTVDGALGWHTEESGRLVGEVAIGTVLDNGGSLIGDGQPHQITSLYSGSSVLSHEILETLADPFVNEWVQRDDGVLLAVEVGDPVEGDGYTIDALGSPVLVSNFILRSWCDPTNEGPFDFLGQLSAPFSMSPGGYMVVMQEGEVSQVYGDRHPSWRKAHKSRGLRRCRKQS